MTKNQILIRILNKFGKDAIGRADDEKYFTRFIVNSRNKSFSAILPKVDGEYLTEDVVNVLDSSDDKAKECEKKSNIFRRIVNGLWK